MKITISYDSCWRNSFLDGDNNKPVPKKGRKYIASMTSLKNEKNFIKREISKNTVMGVLNRLIGDQRKLYQSSKSKDYYFADIENKVSFNDKPETTQEMTYLRNISSGNQYDKNSFIGSVNLNHPLMSSEYASILWGIVDMDFNEVVSFILSKKISNKSSLDVNPFSIIRKIQSLKNIKLNKISNIQHLEDVCKYFKDDLSINNNIKKQFPKMKKSFNSGIYVKNDVVQMNSLYCSAIYLQILHISNIYDIKDITLKGISVNNITPKNFLELFTGGKKIIFGNPYIHEPFIKGQGKIKKLMTKASGTLNINIDINRDKAKEIRTMINNAGVSSFYLGKKGLAFVDGEISIKEIKK
jgi:hypothetical protein